MNIRTIALLMILLFVFTRIMISFFTDGDSCDWGEPDYTNLDFFGKIGEIVVIVILNIAAALSIFFIIGLIDGAILGSFLSSEEINIKIILGFILSALLDVMLFLIIGLHRIPRNIIKILCSLIILAISIIVWGKYFYNYFNNYEKVTETIVTSSEERPLLYFCNIPVQNVSGQIKGGLYSISGEISTTDKLPYWYIEENGNAKYDSVDADVSKIVFISENEKPFLEIISYQTQTKTINHNNGKEDTKTDNEWSEYIFYLPEEIKQYSLNG